MGISSIGNANSFLYKNANRSNHRKTGTVLSGRGGMPAASAPQECRGRGLSANDAYDNMRMYGRCRSEIGEQYLRGSALNNLNLLSQSKGEIQRVENERYVIDISDKIEGNWCIYDKETNDSFAFYPQSTSIQTDENTGKDYIVSCYPWGGLRNVKYADETLIDGIKTFIQTDHIEKSDLNDKYSISVHAYTGIECLKVRGQEGNGSWLMMSGDQQQLDKLQELANLYKEKYPDLVNDDGLAMGLATAEAAGQIVRTENGYITIACNGISYVDNNDPSKNWGFMYSENDTDLYNAIMQAIIDGSIKGGMESVSGWEEWFQEKGYIYERIYSDEELAVMVNGKDVNIHKNF